MQSKDAKSVFKRKKKNHHHYNRNNDLRFKNITVHIVILSIKLNNGKIIVKNKTRKKYPKYQTAFIKLLLKIPRTDTGAKTE